MAHVLLDNVLWRDRGLRAQFRSWGVTCSPWPMDGSQACLPDVWCCDALLVGPETLREAPCDISADPAALIAPVLGWDGEAAFTPEGIPGSSRIPLSGGGGLLACLQVCVAHAVGMRQIKGAVPLLETNPLRVIGHELLTPLTAVQTALEILADQVEDGSPEENDDRTRRMVNLALRNTQRLKEALDWSRGLADTASGAAAEGPSPTPASADGLVTGLARLAPLVSPAEPLALQVSVPEILDLAGRMVRTLREALPGYPVQLHLGTMGASGRIALRAAPIPGSTPPLEDARTGSCTLPSWDPWRHTLEEAVAANIPDQMARRLGGELIIRLVDGVPGLVLELSADEQSATDPDRGLALPEAVPVP